MHVEVWYQFTYTVKSQTHTLIHCHLLSVCERLCLKWVGGTEACMLIRDLCTKYVLCTGCLHGLLTLSSLIYVLICGCWQHYNLMAAFIMHNLMGPMARRDLVPERC